MRAPIALSAGLALALQLALVPQGHAGGPSLEYAVKAAYLYKFAPFVAWPASAFTSPSSPFNLCVAGDDPFGAALDQAVNGQQVDGHPAVVHRLGRVESGSGCHILFVGGSHAQSVADILKGVRGEPVLTVADRGPASVGAVIQFVVKDNRVRFDIDPSAAAANHVAISSKLMNLSLSNRSGT